jgi:hypothetical protein
LYSILSLQISLFFRNKQENKKGDGRQETEDRRRKLEDGSQKTGNGRQKRGNGRRKSGIRKWENRSLSLSKGKQKFNIQ